MSVYTAKWTCWICVEPQETMGRPIGPEVCEKCLRPLADRLCRDELGNDVTLARRGIDEEYWMRQARGVAVVLLKNWKPRTKIDTRP